MGLLEKLQSGESTFGYKGEQPKPITVAGENLVAATAPDASEFDLDMKTPTKYSDIAPEGQGGKV